MGASEGHVSFGAVRFVWDAGIPVFSKRRGQSRSSNAQDVGLGRGELSSKHPTALAQLVKGTLTAGLGRAEAAERGTGVGRK